MPITLTPDPLIDPFEVIPSIDDSPSVPPTLWTGVDQWHDLIEQRLDPGHEADSVSAWDALVAACTDLQGLHEQSREHVEWLLALDHLSDATATNRAYRETQLAGAMAEARLNHLLGTLSDNEYRAILYCLQPLLDGREPPQAYLLGKVAVDDGEQHASWAGAITLTTLTALTDFSQAPRVLLYRFGVHGGWTAHDTSRDVLNALANALGADENRRVKLRPASWTAFNEVLTDQLAALRAAHTFGAKDDTGALERTRLEALDTLCVPLNPPRLLALTRAEEVRRSLRLGDEARTWLDRTPANVRTELAGLIIRYTAALEASERLLRRTLPTRQAYVEHRLRERLEREFDLTAPCHVTLTLPMRVIRVGELISGAAGPGTPIHSVARPSVETEQLSLEDLALIQIDEPMAERLEFLEVGVTPEHHPQANLIKGTITLAWLRQTLPDLDVAGGYERLLADAYLQAGESSALAEEREALYQPYALMLEMHELIAWQQRRLDARGRHIVRVALHATTADAWASEGLNITMRPAALTVFDERSHSHGSPLAGVVLLHDRATDTAVLYLPQAPDGCGFSQYSTLKAATEALEDLFIDTTLRRYLCGRALEGDARALESKVSQALARGYHRLIEFRGPWPTSQSLTANQYLAELGLTITAHRNSSVSNTDRVFEHALQSRGTAVSYIRMALGFVPFVGSLIALADAVEAGIEAGRAFASGESTKGLEATRSVLLSITDVLFDFSPAGLSSGSASLSATARARQLRQGLPGAGRFRQLSKWNARHADQAFAGYERLTALTSQPGTKGRWREVYREPEGDFILRGSTTYAVEWDATYRTWRLQQTRTRSYRQPVALDESGCWQTHGQLYGSLVEGGLRGGGGVQGYLADRLDPLWPDTLRRLLPRWWTDAQFRRQQQLLSECQNRCRATIQSDAQLKQAAAAYQAVHGSPQAPASARAMLAATDRFVEVATTYHETLEALRVLSHGRRRAEFEQDQSQVAATLCSRYQSSIRVALAETDRLTDLAFSQRAEVTRLLDAAGTVPLSVDTVITHSRRIQVTLGETLDLTNQIDQRLEAASIWQRRVSLQEHRRRLHQSQDQLRQMLAGRHGTLIRLALLLDLSPRDNPSLASWLYMRRAYRPARERFDRLARSAYNTGSLNLTPQQRQRLQAQLRESTKALMRTVRRLTVSYPEHFDLHYCELLLEELQKIHDATPAAPIQASRTPTPDRRRLFEADNLLLVGEPVSGEPDVLVIRQLNENPERWIRQPDQRWVRSEQQPAWDTVQPVADVSVLAQQAEARLLELPALRLRLRRYHRPSTLAADLEDLYIGESQDLEFRLRQLQDAGEAQYGPLMQRLQQQANALRAEGRQARIAHCKASQAPTGGILEYLVGEGEATIRRVEGLQASGTTPRNRNWLQEYEILDRDSGKPLFYAHFHYRKAEPRFADFEAAHLKTPAQRYLATAPAGEPAIWRGEISRRLAAALFEPLFA
ncbi:hypothetical protein [Pseudomonas sp. Marseille-Q5115]|uniref:hypothetical protein n=1 Tax=Pseudomonas sp. Marseille-Q5115 TaxID=2866593 RepID=UPI001CE43332|nr:hypothetical protein [Pseudomonas sp. Marseille-Q5115]